MHLLFNLVGIGLIYPAPKIRAIPLRLANWLASVATESRGAAVAYVVTLFYVLPAALLALSRLMA